jgi:aminopeptidase N
VIHHRMVININPVTAEISVDDTITLPLKNTEVTFALHSGFDVSTAETSLQPVSRSADGKISYYQLSRLSAQKKVQLHYSGIIHPQQKEDIFGMPAWVLNEKMLYLDGGSYWYPRFQYNVWKTFELVINLPEGWEMISQGKARRLDGHVQYHMPKPQDDIYLIGGTYTRYSKINSNVEVEVFLLNEDPSLAEKYLDTSLKYLDIYSEWIGPYPYAKFAVLENSWQTGYGMPSFTLLGSHVIRLPFILYTSLPHEIVHNWWGNGVFVDYSKGNWSEGLTAYLADHFSNQQRGQDAEYRRKALERYSNFASKYRDIALTDFRSRHDEASQAVGYSKSMMLFHMLRKRLGEKRFNENLQALWQEYQFRFASFPEVLKQLSAGSDINQQQFVSQWLDRVGAPEISLADASVRQIDDNYELNIEIRQQQKGEPYVMIMPIKIMFANGSSRLEKVKLGSKHETFVFNYPAKPVEIHVDAGFDVFRLLHPDEKPASLGRLFGSKKQILVYPGEADDVQINAWRTLADSWNQKYNNVEFVADSKFKELPDDGAVWILGWDNKLLNEIQGQLQSKSQELTKDQIIIEGISFDQKQHATVLLDKQARPFARGFIGAKNATTILKLARKLPHYSSYGRLVFTTPDATNILKHHLHVTTSPLRRRIN